VPFLFVGFSSCLRLYISIDNYPRRVVIPPASIESDAQAVSLIACVEQAELASFGHKDIDAAVPLAPPGRDDAEQIVDGV